MLKFNDQNFIWEMNFMRIKEKNEMKNADNLNSEFILE